MILGPLPGAWVCPAAAWLVKAASRAEAYFPRQMVKAVATIRFMSVRSMVTVGHLSGPFLATELDVGFARNGLERVIR